MLLSKQYELIGNTPIIKLNDKYFKNSIIYAKLECFNLTGSIKDRPVYQIIKRLYETKKIDKDTTIIEYSSGNTGISLSALCNVFKNKCIIVMPKSMSKQRRKMIKKYNATLVLVDGGMQSAKNKAYELLENIDNAILLNQFGDESNIKAHYKTAQEILEDIPDVEAIVCGIGTGGTITGIGEYFKENNINIKLFGVEPEESPLLTKNYAGSHKIQGIGANFIPPLLKREVITEILTVPSKEALKYQKQFIKNDGLFLGISSGAVLYGAIKVLEKYHFKKIAIICPDSGDRYI